MKRFAPSLLIAFLALTACSSVKTSEHKESDRDPAVSAEKKKTDAHTEAALQRASGGIKKITSASEEPGFTPPLAAEPAADAQVLAAAAVVPAPHASADSHAAEEAHTAAPQAHTAETKAEDPKAHAEATHETHAQSASPQKVSDSHAAPAKASAEENLSDRSLRWLQNGNTRYVMKRFRADGRLAADRDRTKLTQKPHAIVLSCSDSRVPPEIVFDQGIGEIFVIRVAGEALDETSIASIEYAVEHLNPNLIVVMGHTKCGAVDAAIKIKEGTSAGSEHLDRLLAEIRPHLKTRSTEQPSANLEIESALNADGVARDLVSRSEIVRHKIEQGSLKVKSALYWIDSGKVKFY